MLSFESHLVNGTLQSDDGRLVFITYPRNGIEFQYGMDETECTVEIGLTRNKISMASMPYYVGPGGVAVQHNNMYINEAFYNRSIDVQLLLLCAELGVRRWRELSGFEYNAEEFPESISIIAGQSESDLEELTLWLTEILQIKTYQPAQYLYFEEFDTKRHEEHLWGVSIPSDEVEKLSCFATDSMPEGFLLERYLDIYGIN